jgi:hypothetical protein
VAQRRAGPARPLCRVHPAAAQLAVLIFVPGFSYFRANLGTAHGSQPWIFASNFTPASLPPPRGLSLFFCFFFLSLLFSFFFSPVLFFCFPLLSSWATRVRKNIPSILFLSVVAVVCRLSVSRGGRESFGDRSLDFLSFFPRLLLFSVLNDWMMRQKPKTRRNKMDDGSRAKNDGYSSFHFFVSLIT